jgi:NAD(P)-dependent dehydrogenase (short-subunit alcohol dehydrogenase family)
MAPGRALVTGASRGIGRAIAAALARSGHDVLGTSRDPESADGPDGVSLIRLDLADPASVEECISAMGPIDVLVNNAGRSQMGALEDIPPGAVREDFQVNLFGPVRLVQACLPHMRARSRGTVINVGSLAGRFCLPYQSVYCSSKAALAAFSLSLRGEVRAHGIRVVTLEPGDIRTGIEPRLDAPVHGPVLRMKRIRDLRMASAPGPEVVAQKVLEILSDPDPAPFHVVGGSAPLIAFAKRLLPDAFVERLVRRTYGLD